NVEKAIAICFVFFQIAVYLIVLYFLSGIIFNLFPYTKHYSDILYDSIYTPIYNQGMGFLIRYLPILVISAVGLFIIHLSLKLARRIIHEIETGAIKPRFFTVESSQLLYRAFSLSAYSFFMLFMFLLILKVPYAIAFGFLFLAIASAMVLFPLIRSMISCAVLRMRKLFQVGDMVTVNGTFGKVISHTFWQTRIQSEDHSIVTMHNAAIALQPVWNFHSPTQAGCIFTCSLATTNSILPEHVLGSARSAAEEVYHELPHKNIQVYFSARNNQQTLFTIVLTIESSHDFYSLYSRYLHAFSQQCERNQIPVITLKRD
ncbi:MAG: mechanosensitive ion channel family protein, partial [Chitinivibrionales bacterium]|nr:mechanosensitive ion channel family protein [Chitinivibrionales bacterium]